MLHASFCFFIVLSSVSSRASLREDLGHYLKRKGISNALLMNDTRIMSVDEVDAIVSILYGEKLYASTIALPAPTLCQQKSISSKRSIFGFSVTYAGKELHFQFFCGNELDVAVRTFMLDNRIGLEYSYVAFLTRAAYERLYKATRKHTDIEVAIDSHSSQSLLDVSDVSKSGTVYISVGWNCFPRFYMKQQLGISKAGGYKSGPFDLAVTPFRCVGLVYM